MTSQRIQSSVLLCVELEFAVAEVSDSLAWFLKEEESDFRVLSEREDLFVW